MMYKRVVVLAFSCILASTSMIGCKTVGDKEHVKLNSANEDMIKHDNGNQEYDNSSNVAYVTKLFDQSYVHEINIEIAQDDYEDLLKNPMDKTKYQVNATIDGETVKDISFATKGNTSLLGVSSSDSDKFSFKLNFGKFVDGQTYHGLDKLNLNNIYADATYMKDFLSYRIMEEAGAYAPLTSFVQVSINGEPHGLYLAVEEVGDSFLERTYGEEHGELYKPENEALDQMGNIGQHDFGKRDDNFLNMPNQDGGNPPQIPDGQGNAPQIPDGQGNAAQIPNGQGNPPQFPGGDNQNFGPPGGGFGFGSMSAGADLSYIDDQIDSYSDIFDHAETKVEDEDKQRVVEALKKLSSGENLEECIDIDAVIRYFVAHNFVLNFDSYTGNMLHNYYLYEENGVISVLPWDYNLAFGAFAEPTSRGTNNATTLVNYPIDTPLSGAVPEDRPLWNAIVSNEEYMKLYHQYFDELIANYFENGEFGTEIERVYNMIRPYVEKDTNGFYSVEEFDQAYETLRTFCELRTESIRKQLEGEIPATEEGQKEDGVQLVDASSIIMNDMGSQNKMDGDGDQKRPEVPMVMPNQSQSLGGEEEGMEKPKDEDRK